MTPPKKHSAVVATYGDHEVITPENKLRKMVNMKSLVPGEIHPVDRAEQALAELSTEFSSWMDTECERLDKARCDIARFAGTRGLPTQSIYCGSRFIGDCAMESVSTRT
jgi:hypothetical protein